MNSSKSPLMPMIPVPEALAIILDQTAKILLEGKNEVLDTSSSLPNVNQWEEIIDMKEIQSIRNISNPYETLLGRILARPIIAPEPGYPPFPASIMDGYAIRYEDLKLNIESSKHDSNNENDWTHLVTSTVYAGEKERNTNANISSHPNLPAAVYVTTGAVIPTGFDTVVPIENIKVSEKDAESDVQYIQILNSSIKKGEWIRPIGCDIPSNTTVLHAGKVITPAEIGVLLQLNVQNIILRRKLKVGVLSTGNELLTSNHDSSSLSANGLIPDINRPVLLSLLSSSFPNTVIPIDLGIANDTRMDLEKKISCAFQMDDKQSEQKSHDCDVLVTTGGVSMGEKDLLSHVLENTFHAKVHFGRLNMKPGKPTKFMTMIYNMQDQHQTQKIINGRSNRKRMILTLPGNPVSALVCSHLFLCPMLTLLHEGSLWRQQKCQNKNEQKDDNSNVHDNAGKVKDIVANATVHDEVYVSLAHDIKLDQGRPEYHRVMLTKIYDEKNSSQINHHTIAPQLTFMASSTGTQRSSRIMSMCHADGLMCLPRGTSDRPKALKGETFLVLLISSLGITRGRLWNSSSHTSISHDDIQTIRMGKDEGTIVKYSKHMSTIMQQPVPIQNSNQKHDSILPWQVTLVNVSNKMEDDDSLNDIYQKLETTVFTNDEFKLHSKQQTFLLETGATIEDTKERIFHVLHENYVKYCKENNNENQKKQNPPFEHADILIFINKTLSSSSDTNSLTQKGFLRRSTTLASSMRNVLDSKIYKNHKPSTAIAMTARHGASMQNGLAALMDVVVGYFDHGYFEKDIDTVNYQNSGGVLVICLSDIGLEGALNSIKHLWGHALTLGRGDI